MKYKITCICTRRWITTALDLLHTYIQSTHMDLYERQRFYEENVI